MINKKQSHKIQIGKVKLLKSNRPLFPEDLLARDDINGILEDVNKVKPDIKSLIVIWLDQDDVYHFEISDDTLVAIATWMLECTKLDLLINDKE
jgi:hypothetical protein